MTESKPVIPREFMEFHAPHRFKVAYGGRAGMRSWTISRYLLILGSRQKHFILCGREFQSSIRDSAHRLLTDQIDRLGMSSFYDIQRDVIRGQNGTQIVFKGLHHNTQEIKSTEGVTIAWIEEAENVSAESWDVLIPTVRVPGSEIWVSFNPADEDADTYQRFVVHPQPDQVTVYTTYLDTQKHGWLPEEIRKQAEHDKVANPDRYEWVWMGKPRKISQARIFHKVRVEAFETPDDAVFYHGADWGFANDPTVIIRAFERDRILYIDQEAYGYGVEMQELPDLFASIKSTKRWPIPADSARPETVAYMQRAGFNCYSAEKWPGSVEDGIEFIKSYREIVIHPRCVHLQEEARLYSYKIDKRTGHILPIPVDAHNHGWDALRYALSHEIRNQTDEVEWIQWA